MRQIVLFLVSLLGVVIFAAKFTRADGGQSQFYCLDMSCHDVISHGKTLLVYSGRTNKHLSFKKNDDVAILSKPTDKKGGDWVGKVRGKIGLIPKDMIREDRMNKPQHPEIYKYPLEFLPLWNDPPPHLEPEPIPDEEDDDDDPANEIDNDVNGTESEVPQVSEVESVVEHPVEKAPDPVTTEIPVVATDVPSPQTRSYEGSQSGSLQSENLESEIKEGEVSPPAVNPTTVIPDVEPSVESVQAVVSENAREESSDVSGREESSAEEQEDETTTSSSTISDWFGYSNGDDEDDEDEDEDDTESESQDETSQLNETSYEAPQTPETQQNAEQTVESTPELKIEESQSNVSPEATYSKDETPQVTETVFETPQVLETKQEPEKLEEVLEKVADKQPEKSHEVENEPPKIVEQENVVNEPIIVEKKEEATESPEMSTQSPEGITESSAQGSQNTIEQLKETTENPQQLEIEQQKEQVEEKTPEVPLASLQESPESVQVNEAQSVQEEKLRKEEVAVEPAQLPETQPKAEEILEKAPEIPPPPVSSEQIPESLGVLQDQPIPNHTVESGEADKGIEKISENQENHGNTAAIPENVIEGNEENFQTTSTPSVESPKVPVSFPYFPPIQVPTEKSDAKEAQHDHNHDASHDHHSHSHSHGHSHSHDYYSSNGSGGNETSSIILVVKHLSSTLLSFLPEHLQDTILDVDDALVFTGIIALTLVSICVPYFFIEGFMSVRPLKRKVVELNKSLWKVSTAYENQQEEFEIFKKKALDYDEDKKRVEQLEAELTILENLKSKQQEQIKNLKKELKSSAKVATEVENLVETTMEQKSKAVEERDKLKTAVMTLQEALTKTSEELEIAQASSSTFSIDLELANHTNENLTSKITATENEMVELKAKIKTEIEIRQRTAEELEKLTEENDRIQEELRDLKEILHKYEETVSNLNQEIGQKENELMILKDSLGEDSPLVDIAETQAKLKYAEEESIALQSRIDSVTLEKNSLSRNLEQTTKRLENIQAEKEHASNRLLVLEAWFKEKEEELRTAVSKYEAEKNIRGKDKDDLVKMIEEKADEVRDLTDRLEALKDEFEDTKLQHRNEIRAMEAKSHENWLSLCQAERKAQDARKDAEMLRQKLTAITKEKGGDESEIPTMNGDVPFYSMIPPEFVPPPIPEIPPSYFGLGDDYLPPPPLPLDGEREPLRPPPLGRLSPTWNSDLEDSPLSPIRRRGRRDYSDGSSRSGSRSPPRGPPSSRGNWSDRDRPHHDFRRNDLPGSSSGHNHGHNHAHGPKTSSPIQFGANL